MSRPVTWAQLIKVARDRDTQLAVQGRRAESLTVWINALVESAGGSIITDPSPDAPENVGPGLTSDAGVQAAEVMKTIAGQGLGGPALSTAGEDANAWSVSWPGATCDHGC